MKTDDVTDGSLKASLNENAQTSYVKDKYTSDFHAFRNLPVFHVCQYLMIRSEYTAALTENPSRKNQEKDVMSCIDP